MLINNTVAARQFFRTVRRLKDNPKSMDAVCQQMSPVCSVPPVVSDDHHILPLISSWSVSGCTWCCRRIECRNACRMQALQRLKRTDTYNGSGHTYRNAMAYLFASNPDKHLSNVFLESDFCISCFFEVSGLLVSTGPATPSAGQGSESNIPNTQLCPVQAFGWNGHVGSSSCTQQVAVHDFTVPVTGKFAC